MVDPNIRPQLISDRARYCRRLTDEVYPASTIIKASEQDLAWLYPGLSVQSACRRILECGPRLVIATLGADGAFGLTRHVQVHVSIPSVVVVDTIGAGDIFGAGLLTWLYDQQRLRTDLCLDACDLEAALAFACGAASWTCTRTGAEPPTRRDLKGADAP
jgi:fructokinase